MVQLKFDTNGVLFSYFQSSNVLNSWPNAVVAGASYIYLDEAVNQALITDIGNNMSLYTNILGVLNKSLVPVTGIVLTQESQDLTQLSTLKALLDPAATSLTIAQVKTIFRVIFRILNRSGLI